MGTSTFITGFPGFIAGRLIEKLVAPERRLILLCEPRFAARAREDIDSIRRVSGMPADGFEVLEGDITLPGLGLSGADHQRLRVAVDEVFHLAAVYDLAVDKETAYRVNVEGTRNVNEFVGTLSDIRRYNYISTCYVAGRRRGVILENELEHSEGFRNFYEETKYLAELQVEKLKATIPLTIFRPSVVVGDSKTGETAKYDGIYYLIRYLRKAASILRFINVGNREVTLNLVPVDFVIDAIAALSRSEGALGKTVALADPAPLSTAELFDAIAEAMTGEKSLITPPTSLVEFALNLPFSPPLTGLPHSGVPYFFLSQRYDTSLSSELLSACGIRCPDFGSYVRNLVDFVEKHPEI